MNYIPYGRHTITDRDIEKVVEILRSPFITQGPVVSEFEQLVCEATNAIYGVGVNSATSALHISCLALGLKAGDYIWTSPITFVATANCGLYCGASVDFVDINPETGLMCPEELERKLIKAQKTGKLPKIVIPVHLTGSCCEMKNCGTIQRFGFSVIEDATAIGAKYNNNSVDCRYSDKHI